MLDFGLVARKDCRKQEWDKQERSTGTLLEASLQECRADLRIALDTSE